jgi:quinol monooxygenase YgiN
MYGMVGRLKTQTGKREALVEILLRAAEMVGQLPGCHMYIVSKDATDETAVTVVEMWRDKTAHDASLQDARVRALIAEAMPLIGGAPEGTELSVVGGYGLV